MQTSPCQMRPVAHQLGCSRLVCAGRARRCAVSVLTPARVETVQQTVQPDIAAGGDPWEDERWRGIKWTVYRGQAYNLTPYIDRHPGGSWLINLAIGRDCTALFESYHLRPEVAVSHLKRLPVLAEFPVDAVPRSPYPNDSEFYNTVRERVRREVFKGQDVKGAHRSGSEGAALAVIGYSVLAWVLYALDTNPVTGMLLGLAGAWIGLTIQHCGNHGAMSTKAWVNNLMGLTDDLTGGSSLMWRYHHQVSHHVHCNDEAFDEDVMNSAPFLRFDARQPKLWYHQYQHLYMWLIFPFLNLVFQLGDIKGLVENRTVGATLYGASQLEKSTVVLGKLAHYALLWAIPLALHGGAATVSGAAAYIFTQSIVLAGTFAVSHNVPESKPLDAGPTRDALYGQSTFERDWGVQQVLTSANWGGVVGNFFTGGLNLQIEHHLFPAISFMHYPAISAIVRDECRKRGVLYNEYPTLTEITGRFMRYMKEVGVAEQVPLSTSNMSAAMMAKL
ncbi:fatty acyl delta4 desaturase [Haematococcus lacustris]